MTSLFADLIGQPRAVALLEAVLTQQRFAPAYLFAGADGVGRRLAALRFLEGVLTGPGGAAAVRRRLVEGNHPDLLWVEPTYQHQGQLIPISQAEEQGLARRALPQLRLEQIRAVARFLGHRPVEANRRLVVLEQAEAMAEGAANALLKTLEEPGAGLLILTTAMPERLLSTIRSRCQQIPFVRLDPADLLEVLARVQARDQQSNEPKINQPESRDGDGRRDEASGEDAAVLLALAAGSPGALLRHRRQWQQLPEGLAERLRTGGREPLEALALARDLTEALDVEQQLWLLDWWQWVLWAEQLDPAPLQRLERLRQQLRAYVQPRLAWEVALLDLGGVRR